ncbi:MAG: cytochrome c oxidase subunit II [Proteobacteria bacterium]|nr:cytochrome c oxidase subunit II [Pseudomonadota bacterium]
MTKPLMKRFATLATLLVTALTGTLLALPALANSIHPGGFPTPVGPVAEEIGALYNIIFVIIAVVMVIVAVPVLYILWRFRRTKVAKPATFSHNLGLELLWTIIPALICIYIAVASYFAMVKLRTMPDHALNVEVVAYQFGWDFFYPDASENGVHVAAAEPTTDDPEVSLPGAARQTKELVVPVGRPVVVHVTSSDVIHSFFVPHLGVKIDAIPGRINYTWFQADKAGDYLGQCAELCGQAHGEMFFRVKAVPEDQFEAYMAERRVAAGLPAQPAKVPDANAGPVDVVSATAVAAAVASSTGVISSTSLVSPTPLQNPGPGSLTSNTTLGNGLPGAPHAK